MNDPSTCRHNNPPNLGVRKTYVQGSPPHDGAAFAVECLKCGAILNVFWAGMAGKRAGAFAANAALRKVFSQA